GHAASEGPLNQEEINRFIRRQNYYIRSEQIVDRVLQSDEFQHDPSDPSGEKKSQWLAEHMGRARKSLMEDIEVTAIPDTDLFTIKVKSANPAEGARLVNAIARVY